MASALDICNSALALIGQRTIVASIDPPEQSVEAEYCALFWPQVLDYALYSSSWSFATYRQVLADVTASYPPPSEFLYTYTLPSGCLNFIGVRSPDSVDDDVNDECKLGAAGENIRVIYTNTEAAIGVYVKRVENPTVFPPSFVRALEYLMAAKLAVPIIKGTEGLNLGDGLMQRGEGFLANARATDANQSNMRDTRNPSSVKASWLSARDDGTANSRLYIADE